MAGDREQTGRKNFLGMSFEPGYFRQLFRIVLPIAAQTLMTALVSVSDTLMLGAVNQESFAAASQAGQVSMLENFIIFGVTAGISTMAAQYWGKGDRKSVERIQSIALRYTLPFGLLTMLLALFLPGQIMDLLATDAAVRSLGAEYLRIVGVSYLFTAVSQVVLTVMKNSDRVARSSAYAISTVILNIVLNALLIFNPFGIETLRCVEGIRGAALATSLSKLTEVGLCLLESVRHPDVRLRLRQIFEKMTRLSRDFWHFSWPLIANTVAWGGGMFAFSVIIGQLGGEDNTSIISAHAMGNIVKNCCDCLGAGVAHGAAILLGNRLGRGEFEQAKRDGRSYVVLSLYIGVISGLILLALSPLVIRLAHLMPDFKGGKAGEYLQSILYMCSYYMIGRTLNTMLINGIFSAGGDTRFGFWCDLVNLWCIIIPAACLAAFVFHAPPLAVYFILYLDEFTKIPIEAAHYRKYRWVRNIAAETEP